jgi:hypothetical protein
VLVAVNPSGKPRRLQIAATGTPVPL